MILARPLEPTARCDKLQSLDFAFATTAALRHGDQLALLNIKLLPSDNLPFVMPLPAQSTTTAVAIY